MNFKFTKKALRATWRLKPPVLALGGGGARGFAHLGVLAVLDEANLPVSAIVGTSMGAVTGGMYLAHGSAEKAIDLWRQAFDEDLIPRVQPVSKFPDADTSEHPLLQVARRIRNRVVITFAMNRSTILETKSLSTVLEFLIPDIEFADLPRAFVAVATDVDTGEEVRLRKGPLRSALLASSAIPGVIPAVEVDARRLVDGGVLAEIPVAAAKEIGWPVVAVDASMDVPPVTDNDLVLDTMMRTQMMTAGLLRSQQLRRATHVIRPQVGRATWADWGRSEELVSAGRAAAEEFLGL